MSKYLTEESVELFCAIDENEAIITNKNNTNLFMTQCFNGIVIFDFYTSHML